MGDSVLMVYEPDNVTQDDISRGNLAGAPRLRVNAPYTKSSPLTLTNSWQKINFGGSSSLNVNTFPMSNDNQNRMIYWDNTAGKFKFMTEIDRNYGFSLFIKTTSSSLLNLTNLSMATIQIQFVVPGGGPNGTDYKFPFPDDEDAEPGLDLNLVNAVSPYKQEYYTNLSIDDRKRLNGMYVNMRISSAILGVIRVVSANLIFYGR